MQILGKLIATLLIIVFISLFYFQISTTVKFSEEDLSCIKSEWRDNSLLNSTQDFGTHYQISFSDTQQYFKWLHLPQIPVRPFQDILIIVTSRCDNFARRNLLRSTWMNSFGNRIQSIFLIGLGPNIDPKTREIVMMEAKLYGDMVVTDLEDTYDKLAFKSISLLLYAVSKFPSARLIGKVDEDVMFFPDELVSLVDNSSIDIHANNMYGYIIEAGAPARLEYGTIQASVNSYGCSKYPEYLAGPMYLATRKAAKGVLQASKHRKFLISEDTLITGILAEDAGVERILLPQFHTFPEPTPKKEGQVLAWHTKLDNQRYLKFYNERRNTK